MRVKATVRRFGESLGVVIPSEEVARQGLTEGDSVEVVVEKRTNLRELFGSAKFRKSAQETKDDSRRGWRD